MTYNPEMHHRRSIRLKGFDYSRQGLYFITICTQERECLFGEIGFHHPVVLLSKAGEMTVKWYYELTEKYPDKICHEMVVMPNHIHFIIENMGNMGNNAETGNVEGVEMHDIKGAHAGAPLRGRPFPIRGRAFLHDQPINEIDPVNKYGFHNKKLNAPIGDLVNWYKTMTTNDYIRGVNQFGWKRFNGKLWQRNYYEHIIRSAEDYDRIACYINDNPAQWMADRFFREL